MFESESESPEPPEIDNQDFSSQLQYKRFDAEITWTIDNILEWVKTSSKCTHKSSSEKSAPFKIQNGSNGVMFELEIYFSNEYKEYIGLYLNKLGFDDVELKCTMMAVENSDEIFASELKSRKFTVKDDNGGSVTF
jgi:hypothetical protein